MLSFAHCTCWNLYAVLAIVCVKQKRGSSRSAPSTPVWIQTHLWSFVTVLRAVCFKGDTGTRIQATALSSLENFRDLSVFYLPTCVCFPSLQGILRDEGDINMLGEDFRLAYQKRRDNALPQESWNFPHLISGFATRCHRISNENFHLLLTLRNSFLTS